MREVLQLGHRLRCPAGQRRYQEDDLSHDEEGLLSEDVGQFGE